MALDNQHSLSSWLWKFTWWSYHFLLDFHPCLNVSRLQTDLGWPPPGWQGTSSLIHMSFIFQLASLGMSPWSKKRARISQVNHTSAFKASASTTFVKSHWPLMRGHGKGHWYGRYEELEPFWSPPHIYIQSIPPFFFFMSPDLFSGLKTCMSNGLKDSALGYL